MVRNKQQQPSSTGARLGALRPRNIGLVAVLCLVTLGAALPQTGAELVGDARALLEQWVETRRVISLEERDWSLGRQTLDDRIELIEREIEQKREQIAGTEESISEADRKREELLQKNALLEEASRVLADRVGGLEARTKTLLVRLPEPIRERVMPLSQRLPEDPADTKPARTLVEVRSRRRTPERGEQVPPGDHGHQRGSPARRRYLRGGDRGLCRDLPGLVRRCHQALRRLGPGLLR